MNPFFFGDSERQLFGVYHPARESSRRGVVICHPWAREYLLAHPTLKLLSQHLAEAGWHTLRFDYFGTGDSAGSSRDGHRKQWLEDVETAIEELVAIAGVTELALVGMRHGATLAAMATARRPDVSRVVLWDPVVDGSAWLRDLGTPGDMHGDVDIAGAVLTPRLRSEFGGITSVAFPTRLPRTLIVSTQSEDAATDALAARLQAADIDCAMQRVPDVQVWREEWGRGGKGLAVSAANCITAWLN